MIGPLRGKITTRVRMTVDARPICRRVRKLTTAAIADRRGAAVLLSLLVTAGGLSACDSQRQTRSGAAAEDSLRWPSYRSVPHRICMSETNTLECARAVEAYQLRHGHDHLARRDSSFVIGLPSGDSVVIRDRAGDEFGVGGATYTYLGFLPSLEQHLLEVQYYEGGAYLLVNGRSGERQPVASVPTPSPDGRRFAVVSSGLIAYSSNALEIWRVGEDGVELEWQEEFRGPEGSDDAEGPAVDWSPRGVVWTSPRSLRVYLERRGERGAPEPAGSVVLRRGEGAWSFERDPAGVVATVPSTSTGPRRDP